MPRDSVPRMRAADASGTEIEEASCVASSKIAAVALAGALALTGCGSRRRRAAAAAAPRPQRGRRARTPRATVPRSASPTTSVAVATSRSTTRPTRASRRRSRARCHLHRGQGRRRTRTTPSARERLVTLAERGYQPDHRRSASSTRRPQRKVAAEYPDTNFAVIDGYSTTLPKAPLKNLTDLGLRRGAGLLPGRRRGGAEDRGQARRLPRRRRTAT